MHLTNKYVLLLFSVFMLLACKGKKKPSLAGEDPVEVEDFIEFFPTRQLPYQLADSNLKKKEKDSLQISRKVFTQFVPDSFLVKLLGKNSKPTIYPLGRVEDEEGVYLFTKLVTPNQKAACIFAFDKKKQFLAGMPLFQSNPSASTGQNVVMDRRYTITRTITRRNVNGTVSEGKDVYVLNGANKSFDLIMTDALDDKLTELINPIDTLSRKHKLAADYVSGKMNLVSIRDGRRPNLLNFFIHFEKNNAECTGELKGEATIKSSTLAEYRKPGDPCVMRFIFSTSSVTVREVEGCGSHRGLRCSFDGNFARKKVPKAKAPTPKKPPAKNN